MNEQFHEYHLQKYRGTATRHTCPKCGRKKCFTYYVDENETPLDQKCGRCDHESECGYHYTPKDYFRDNKQFFDLTRPRPQFRPLTPNKPKTFNIIHPDWVTKFLGKQNNLIKWLSGYFDNGIINRLVNDYKIGGTKTGATIYWQIDIKGNVRTGKIISYQSNGHRYKDEFHHVNWVHSKLIALKLIPQDFNLYQCLFGEQLLKKYPYKKVILVEAEKTALIGCGLFPEFVWLATGGKSQMSKDRLQILQGKSVILIPDIDALDLWQQKCEEMKKWGINVGIAVSMYETATDEQKRAHIDIADLFVVELEKRKQLREKHEQEKREKLNTICEQNPTIKYIVDEFDCELLNT